MPSISLPALTGTAGRPEEQSLVPSAGSTASAASGEGDFQLHLRRAARSTSRRKTELGGCRRAERELEPSSTRSRRVYGNPHSRNARGHASRLTHRPKEQGTDDEDRSERTRESDDSTPIPGSSADGAALPADLLPPPTDEQSCALSADCPGALDRLAAGAASPIDAPEGAAPAADIEHAYLDPLHLGSEDGALARGQLLQAPASSAARGARTASTIAADAGGTGLYSGLLPTTETAAGAILNPSLTVASWPDAFDSLTDGGSPALAPEPLALDEAAHLAEVFPSAERHAAEVTDEGREGASNPVLEVGSSSTDGTLLPAGAAALTARGATPTAQSGSAGESARAAFDRPVPFAQLPVQIAHVSARLGDQGSGTMRLRLDPPHLGQIHVQVEASDEGISVRIVAQSGDACALLGDQRSQLKEELGRSGLTLHTFSTSVGADDSGGTRQRDGRPDLAWLSPQRPDREVGLAGGTHGAPISGAPAAVAPGYRRRLDTRA
jgi:hypothetical protein